MRKENITMKKIVTCNLIYKNNFGSPSILFGMVELFKELYGEDFEIINLEASRVYDGMDQALIICNKIKTYKYLYPSKRNLIRFIFGKSGLKTIVKHVKNSDLVVDLNGICFCDSLSIKEIKGIRRLWNNFKNYTVSIVAKKVCKRNVIKNTASFGPITNSTLKKNARYMCDSIFDHICARELESKRELKEIAKINNNVLYSADTANLMPFHIVVPKHSYIVISVSYRIDLNWKSSQSYVECMVLFIKNIIEKYRIHIKLLPNENHVGALTDNKIVKDISAQIQNAGYMVESLDSDSMTALEIKNIIASASLVIASRYHSCVAALSSGVPLLTIGWHYKYEELLKMYNQQKWHLSSNKCTADNLICMFDELWSNKEQIAEEIKNVYPKVRENIISVGKKLYE